MDASKEIKWAFYLHFIWVQDYSWQAIKHFASHKVTSHQLIFPTHNQTQARTVSISSHWITTRIKLMPHRFMEVDIEISLWRWLVTCPSGCVLMAGELRMIALWSCCSDWRQTDSKHWGPCIHRINSVYCILSTDTYTVLVSGDWWGNKENTLHCVVLHFHFHTEFNGDHWRTH